MDDLIFTKTTDIMIVDPAPSLLNSDGSLKQDPEVLATLGRPVEGLAADDGGGYGVLVLLADFAGQHLTLTLLSDQDVESTSAGQDGVLAPITAAASPVAASRPKSRPPSGSASLPLVAVQTRQGPRAFALYYPPADFDRSGADNAEAQRAVSLQVDRQRSEIDRKTIGKFD